MSKLDEMFLWDGVGEQLVSSEVHLKRIDRLNDALDILIEMKTNSRQIKIKSAHLKTASAALAESEMQIRKELRELHAILDTKA